MLVFSAFLQKFFLLRSRTRARTRLPDPLTVSVSHSKSQRTPENMAADRRGDAERAFRARVPPLLTDLYHFTMAYAHWRAGRARERAVFELFFRENPFGGGFTLFAGLQDCLLFLRGFRFTEAGEQLRPSRLQD